MKFGVMMKMDWPSKPIQRTFPEAGVCMNKQCRVLGMSSRLLACEISGQSMSAIAATVLSLSCNMIREITVFFVVFSFVGVVGAAHAADQSKKDIPSVEELVATVRPSVVTIRHVGRGGNDAGLGTGFVISSDGLIATNLHAEMVQTIVNSSDSKHFWGFQHFGRSLWQPLGENTFRKAHPKTHNISNIVIY